jgi:hypothetical protein
MVCTFCIQILHSLPNLIFKTHKIYAPWIYYFHIKTCDITIFDLCKMPMHNNINASIHKITKNKIKHKVLKLLASKLLGSFLLLKLPPATPIKSKVDCAKLGPLLVLFDCKIL